MAGEIQIFKVQTQPSRGKFRRNAGRQQRIPCNTNGGLHAYHIPLNRNYKFFRTKHVN